MTLMTLNKTLCLIVLAAAITGQLSAQTPTSLKFSTQSVNFRASEFSSVTHTQTFTATERIGIDNTGLKATISQPWVSPQFTCVMSGSTILTICAITVDSAFLGAGTYQATLTVEGADNGPQTIAVQFIVDSAPAGVPTFGAVVNAADYYRFGPLITGEIVSIFGVNLGPIRGVAFDGSLSSAPTSLAGTRVLFNGVAAPLIYVQDRQINAVIPTPTALPAQVQVEFQNVLSSIFTAGSASAAYAPGIFTLDFSGTGQAVILNQDGTLNTVSTPAPRGSKISIYATGLGQTNPPIMDGKIATAPAAVLAEVSVYFSTDQFFPTFPSPSVTYAGLAPGSVGVYRVDAVVPLDLPAGSAPLRLRLPGGLCVGSPFFCSAGTSSNIVGIAVR